MLKWTLGTHKRSSNVVTWGETGRYPICSQVVKQVLKYKQRLEESRDEGSPVYYAFKDQVNLNLSWHKSLSEQELETKFSGSPTATHRPFPSSVKRGLQVFFVEKWTEAINDQPKLRFYRLLNSQTGLHIRAIPRWIRILDIQDDVEEIDCQTSLQLTHAQH